MLLRPVNLVITAAAVFFSFLITGSIISTTYIIALEFIFIAAAGYSINDIRDVAADKINKPERPIPSGSVSLREAKIISLSFIAAAVLTMFFLPLPAALVSALVLLMAMLYNYSGKKRGLAGNIITALMTASPMGVVITVRGADPVLTGLVCFAFLLMLMREVVKDLEDLPGDKAAAKMTAAAAGGSRLMLLLLSILTLFFLIATLTLSRYVTKTALYLSWVSAGCSAVNLAALVYAFKGRYRASSLIYKLNIILGMGGIWLSK